MIGLPYLALGALVLALASAGGGYWKGREDGKASVQAKWDADKVIQRQAVDDANTNAQAAAELYERERTKRRERVVVVQKEIRDAIQSAPDWSNQPVPDGVRAALERAASATLADLPQPDSALPAPVSASGAGQRGDGPGINPRAGWLDRLFQPAISPQ